MGDADEEAAAAEAAPPRMDEDGNIIDSPKPIRRRPFSLRRMVGDVRRKLKKEMQVPPTYGPPYLENMPHIDIGLIDQCDQGEPNAQEIHGVLNEGVNPNCTDPENFGETPLFKIGRHCGGRDVMKIVEMLKMAGVKGAMCVDKVKKAAQAPTHYVQTAPRFNNAPSSPHAQVNELGLTPLCRAAMSAPPPGPPKKIRLKFIQWLIDEHANVNHVDKGGFTPLCHAASHGDYDGVRLLLENGAEVEPVSGMGVKRPVKDAVQMGRMSATVKFPAKDRKKELVAILERYKFMQATARDKAESERRKVGLLDSHESPPPPSPTPLCDVPKPLRASTFLIPLFHPTQGLDGISGGRASAGNLQREPRGHAGRKHGGSATIGRSEA